MSAIVAAPERVLWEEFGRHDRAAHKRRRKLAEHVARLVSLTLDLRQATAWYQITRERVCEHPEQSVLRYREGEIVFCTCGACAARWKEAPLVAS